MKARRHALAIALVVFMGVALSTSVSAQEEPSNLTLRLPATLEPGVEVDLTALLTDADGQPVNGAEILFKAEFEFLNTFDETDLGRAITGEDGTAVIRYDPRVEGDITVIGEYEGGRRLAASSAKGTMFTATGSQVYEELPPFRIPGANLWMAVIILSVVWLVFISSLVILGLGIYRNRSPQHELKEASDA